MLSDQRPSERQNVHRMTPEAPISHLLKFKLVKVVLSERASEREAAPNITHMIPRVYPRGLLNLYTGFDKITKRHRGKKTLHW